MFQNFRMIALSYNPPNKDIPEILLVNKPKGITSFDVIRILRRELRIKKMGHAGTLDPLATGLMIIGIGHGTKKLNEYLKLSKVYVAEILLGKKTDTGDLEGKVLEEKKIEFLDENRVKEAALSLKGELDLPIPAYSAIKVNGQPLYKRARRGEFIVPTIRKMKINDVLFVGLKKDGDYFKATLELYVESGVYIRSVAEELGRRLGLPATLGSLCRTQIGDFSLREARSILARVN